jgi:phosphoribosylformylglycinamidine synthase
VPGEAEAGPATARALHKAISKGLVRACHDCSEGGLAVALAEMVLGGELGAWVRLADLSVGGGETPADAWLLFSESNGRYVVEVRPEDVRAFEALMAGMPWARVGEVTLAPELSVTGSAGLSVLFSTPLQDIRKAWRGHLEERGARREGAR